MSGSKWGESFLKSGLPLEHITLMTFKSLNWECSLHYEYLRENREGTSAWFEVDMVATSREWDLQFLVECKYHDTSRFWFFLPCLTIDHLSEYDALSVADVDLELDIHVFNSAPFESLKNQRTRGALDLASKSIWGVVTSHDGAKQDNSIQTALNQLAYSFVPYNLGSFYELNQLRATAIIPMIVTNAEIFRIKPEITNLDVIREASAPSEIADEVGWTWCYFAPNNELKYYNLNLMEKHETKHKLEQYEPINTQLEKLWSSPSWVVVANIDSLAEAVQSIHDYYVSLEKDYSSSSIIEEIWEERISKKNLQDR